MEAADTMPQRRWKAYAPAWLVLLMGLGASALGAHRLWQDAERADLARFQTMVTNIVEHLDSRTERYALELERFADLLASQAETSEEVWEESVTRLGPASNLPALMELAFLTNKALAKREDFFSGKFGWTNSVKIPKYQLRNGAPPLAGAYQWRANPSPSLSDTLEWIGLRKNQYLIRGTLTGRMIASPRRLVPATNSTLDGTHAATVSFFLPVFMTDIAALTREIPGGDLYQTRSHRLRGLVVGTLSWQAFLATAMAGDTTQVRFGAYSDTNMTAETWMGLSAAASISPAATEPSPWFRHTQTWPFYRQSWRLVFESTPLFNHESQRYRAWGLLGGGSALALLLSGLLAVQVRARLRQEIISARLQEALVELDQARRERERLSHDLHDGTIQSLDALQLGLSRAGEQARESLPALGTRLVEFRRNLTAVIGELRGYILRHEAGEGPEGDLAGVLGALVERLRSTTEMDFHVALSPEAAGRLRSEQAVHLANIAREALSNALRHSQANRVTVELRDETGRVALEISDDGCGFVPSLPPQAGLGLTSMKTRAREAGGELEVESRAGEGTRILVTVPFNTH